jgi:hypothetical protein
MDGKIWLESNVVTSTSNKSKIANARWSAGLPTEMN